MSVNAIESTETAIFSNIGPVNIEFKVPTKKKFTVRGLNYAFLGVKRTTFGTNSQDSIETRVSE